METVVVALIVGVIGPATMAYITNRHRRLAALRGQGVALRRLPGDDETDRAELAAVEVRIAELESTMVERLAAGG